MKKKNPKKTLIVRKLYSFTVLELLTLPENVSSSSDFRGFALCNSLACV